MKTKKHMTAETALQPELRDAFDALVEDYKAGCRAHVRGGRVTPAMAANATDRLWEIEDIVRTAVIAMSVMVSWPALAQNPMSTESAYMYGIGRSSCGNWLSQPEHESEGETWILGYWSGLNVLNARSHLVGGHSDGQAIIGEVKKICLSEPSTVLNNAVARVYYQFEQDGK